MTRILIVDDKPDNLYYLKTLLTGSGYDVETAHHGAEALVRARATPPDVVVSDLLMPVMDGYTLLRHWKADPRLRRSPFVVYTATYTEPEDERLALSLGADAFILKPSEPEDFLGKLREVETRVGLGAEPMEPAPEEDRLEQVYSQTLVRKLEEKTLQLEEANRSLQAEVAERRQTEETLRESEERFRQLAESISEVFWITDVGKTRMLYVSPAYEKIWGRTRASLYAEPSAWLEAIHPEDREEIRRRLPGQEQQEYDVTYRVLRPDGSLRWIHDRAFPVRDASGVVYRVVGLAEDVTERKAIDAQFLRAQRMESLGTLAGGIAHDLNNVLTPILMAVDLLRLNRDVRLRERALESIEECARKGAEMVRQVLSFARGLEGRRVEVEVESLIREVAGIANDTFLKAIDIRVEVAPDLPRVTGDPTQLHQVLLNLCVNARDAMPRGGVLWIRATRRHLGQADVASHTGVEPGQFVAVAVQDTGTGMPPEVLDRIFEPFYTTKEPGRGTGLGLSTSLAIVRSHGGFFDVTSREGSGTEFTVYLPAAASAGAPGEAAHREEAPRGHGELILVVDDEALIREVTRQILEAYGYRVELAANGEEGVAQYARLRGDVALVLTDMMMPVMDGAALIAAIHALDPAARIIAVSGLTVDPGLPPEANVRHLTKPYSRQELLQAIQSMISSRL